MRYISQMQKRLVDPVHIFDAKGRSLLQYEHLEKENKRLTALVERLQRMLRRQIDRAGPPEARIKQITH